MKTAFALLFALSTLAFAQVENGKPAPNFTLTDCAGKTHSLTDFKGKTVVLEWVNHECPFVEKHYSGGNMQALQKAATEKGAIWLSVASSAPGKPGAMSPADAQAKCTAVGSKATAYLFDSDGKVGKLYGARVTPELYIINPEGLLVYQGAIDDKKSTDAADIAGAKNYVQAALDEVLANKPVSMAKTEPYGCSVNYAK